MSSTENQQQQQQNGTTSNGLKTTALGASRGATTNSSFLYSSNSLLSGSAAAAARDKTAAAAAAAAAAATRQPVPPPTLPKYTSSFNAGSNGTSSAGERLSKDRDGGGSYRLASLDRLALRQRILDGESNKANGDVNSVREERPFLEEYIGDFVLGPM